MRFSLLLRVSVRPALAPGGNHSKFEKTISTGKRSLERVAKYKYSTGTQAKPSSIATAFIAKSSRLFEQKKMKRIGEEKKEDKGGKAGPKVELEGKGFDRESEDIEDESDFLVLQSDFAASVGGAHRRYRDGNELQAVFDQNGLGDLNVVLVDGEARLVMVKHQHNLFTSEYLQDLIESLGKWMKISGTNNVEIDVQGEKPIPST